MVSKFFRDPIHGLIPVSGPESQLLDTAPFRRLRNIHQLALTYLVYHGAEHSRFGHSVGVMHQATEVFDAVTRDRDRPLEWDQEDLDRRRQLLRLAALCHDLGHSPFSHSGEEAGLMPAPHEDYSAAILRATTGSAGEVRQVIESDPDGFCGVTVDEVADVITGQALGIDSFLSEIMSGELDADRTDYLQRDSLYCGVMYGRFDSERLVKTLTWKEHEGNPVLAIGRNGIHAAEALLLARYFMFTQVYFHAVRRAYDHHLGEALRGLLPEGHYPPPENLDAYMEWDDLSVQSALRSISGDGSKAGNHARRIESRDHYRVAYETEEHPSNPELGRWEELCGRVKDEFGDEVAIDSAEKAPFRFDRGLNFFPVAGDPPTSIAEESVLIRRLEELRLQRILCPKMAVPAVKAFCKSLSLNVRRHES